MRKLLSTAAAIGIFASSSLIQASCADFTNTSLPVPVSNYESLNKNVDISTNGNKMTIEVGKGVTGAVGTAYWDSFNIGKDATVEVDFTAHHQTSLNKVTGTNLSQIYGSFINGTACAGGAACNYQDTGKVILINPNGIVFGSGANINLNSFTASTLEGNYNKGTEDGIGTLVLSRNKNINSQGGIKILADENNKTAIKADKNVALVSDNITVYNNSKISTNTTLNDVTNNGESFGKVKLVTSDGVNFTYYNNGAINGVNNTAVSADKMVISINGNISSGNIDIRNHSTNADSEINLNGAVLRAYKAEKGNDGNIWLTANNKIVAADSSFTTSYDPNGNQTTIANRKGSNNDPLANVLLSAGNGININGKSAINANGNVTLKTTNAGTDHDIIVNDSSTKIETGYDVLIDSSNIASVQNNSAIRAKNITVKGAQGAYVTKSSLTTKDFGDGNIYITAANGKVWTDDARINSGKNINIEATEGEVQLENSQFDADGNINITSYKKIDSARVASSKYNTTNNINVTSTGDSIVFTGLEPFNGYNELNLKAAKNIQIYKDNADLTVANVNLDAGEDITLQSTNNNLTVKPTTKFKKAKNVYLVAGNNVETDGQVDANNLKFNIEAGNNINVNLLNVGNREKGLVAKAGNTVTVTTPGVLSVSSLIAENGDMNINATKVIAGKSYVADSAKIPGDTADSRSFISVENGTFNSNTSEDAFYVTDSDTPLNDGTDRYMRHHIQYGNGTEKIVLRNPRPYKTPAAPEVSIVQALNVNDNEAQKINKIPRQPESYSNSTSIADQRTSFVDVFAAASQIEIEDDEEE